MGANYVSNMRAAAFRHLEAGTKLSDSTRRDVAGYLFGLAAECALKQIMLDSGMRPSEPRSEDPFYAHFEELKRLVRDNAKGRRSDELRRYAEKSSFMQHWDVTMRYSDGREIRDEWITRWHEDAKNITGVI